MNTNSIDEALYNRDGAGQDQRALPLLDPEKVPVDERTAEDLLRFAQQFADQVYYYDTENRISGTWDAFLIDNPSGMREASPAVKTARREAWLQEILAYYENPSAWEGAPELLNPLTRPHLALFVTFLKLTRHIRTQLNSLTGKHLDYFYRKALGLTRQDALPDHVNVIVDLAEDIDQFLLEKGARLSAGKDSEGKDLIYETASDVVLTKGKVDELRTVFVERAYLGAEAYHQQHLTDADQGFSRLLRLAYGNPAPGDPLPGFRRGSLELPFTEATLNQALADLAAIQATLGMDPDLFRILGEIAESQLPMSEHGARWNQLIKAPEMQYEAGSSTILIWGERATRAELPAKVRAKLAHPADGPAIVAASESLRILLGNVYTTAEDFRTLMQARQEELAATTPEEAPDWRPVYLLLNRAWRSRIRAEQRRELHDFFRNHPSTSNALRFENMVGFALGEAGTEPGEYILPLYAGGSVGLNDIRRDRSSEIREVRERADVYILESLFMTNLEFDRLLAVRDLQGEDIAIAPAFADTDWTDALALLARARREKSAETITDPQVEEWNNIYAFADASQNLSNVEVGVEENDPRWKTFGAPQQASASDPAHSAQIGFAIGTPLLELQEGDREISLYLSFQDAGNMQQVMAELLEEADSGKPFFRFLFSAEAGWISPNTTTIAFGGYLKRGAGIPIDLRIIPAENRIAGTFTAEIHNALILWSDGRLFRLIDEGEKDRVKYRTAGQIDYSGPTLRITEDQLLLDAMKIDLRLNVQAPAVIAPDPESEDFVAGGGFPMLKVLLNDQEYIDPVSKQKRFRKRYQRLRSLKLASVFMEVAANGLQNYLIQNDFEELDPSKPFEPFGNEPINGNAFYLTHPEIAAKRLEELRVALHWLNAPEKFADYYKNYDRVEQDNFDLPASDYTIKSNADFKVRLGLYDQREILLEEINENPFSLFDANDARKKQDLSIEGMPGLIAEERVDYKYKRLELGEVVEESEVLDWPRYVRLELDGADLQHTRYSLVLTAQGYNQEPAPGEEAKDTRTLPLNAPYVPLLKSMEVGYTARIHVHLDRAQTEAKLLHLHPFGYAELPAASSKEAVPFLLPQYVEEGALYIALDQVTPPDVIQVLFQMAEGSANPDLTKARISWAFMQHNRWIPFGDADIISDRTNGLLRSGIIKFRIPEGVTISNTVLPTDKVWLRATVAANSDSVSDVINIRAQAIEAVFVNQDNAEDHLLTPLAAGAITATVDSISELAEVQQPYPSSGGKAAESDISFYTRISERLRHKHRAISAWDYERLTLERFPDIFKAKCLPNNPYDATMEPGLVRMVVIPDIIGRFPFNPYQPKVPAEKLVEIREYLEAYMPPFATLKVLNPRYLQIHVRVAVGFREGYNEGFYKAQLEEDLRRYLAPWAYQEGEDIVLGGKIYGNVIVNFIEERPYIDYVGRIDLFQSSDGKNFLDSKVFNKNESLVRTDDPDVVLVSALHHEVEVIREGSFRKELEQGIGHARVETDFYIGSSNES